MDSGKRRSHGQTDTVCNSSEAALFFVDRNVLELEEVILST
jgi:hypothetical protein